jgi:hypothetical protein
MRIFGMKSAITHAVLVSIALAGIAVVGGPLASTAYATGVCDNYRPSIYHGFCPVNGTLANGEIIYVGFNKVALGNEIAVAASRSLRVSYWHPGQPGGRFVDANGSGTYLSLSHSGGQAVDPSCGMVGANVTGNCDVQYQV